MKRALRWQGMRRQRVANDLAQHFRDRVLAQVEDILDTGRRGGVPAGLMFSAVINGLIYIAGMLSYTTGGTRQQFLTLCGGMFDAARRDAPMIEEMTYRSLREGRHRRNRQ